MRLFQPEAGPDSRKLMCFEAIRGLAAFAVLASHFLLAFWPAMVFREGLGWNELPGAFRFLARFPGKGMWDAHTAVTIFFVLSGFVLSMAYFRGAAAPAMGSAALRRFPRLMIPVLASVLLAYLLLSVGAMCNQDAVKFMNQLYGLPEAVDYNARNGFSNKWLSFYYFFPPDLSAAFHEGSHGAFAGAIPVYNLVLWTMPYELAGSFLVYAFLALFGTSRNRWILYGLCGAYLYATDRTFLLDFVLGMAVCDAWVADQRTRRTSLPLWPALVAVAVAIFLVKSKPIVALVVVGAAALTPRLQQLLEARWLAFLGRISFSLYLIHMPIFCSVGCGLYLTLCRDLGWPHAAGSVTAMLAATVASVIAAWIFYHAFDRTAIALTRRVDHSLFRPKAASEAAPDVPAIQRPAA